MLRVHQVNEGEWQLLRGDVVLSTHTSYADAMLELGTLEGGDTETTGDGLLPETWVDDGGIAFSESIEQGFRDFTSCTWTWRDPNVSLIPLMLQTETDVGHWGAELAGFVESFSVTGGTVHSSGRFYDSETGRQFRDMLLDGRRFGVSVDPGPNTIVEEECVSVDPDDGWCEEWRLTFTDYEIIGVTGTPFPGFEQAAITLAGSAPAAVAASTAPARPPSNVGRPVDLSTRSMPAAAIVAGAGTPGGRTTGAVVAVPTRPPARWFDDPHLPFPTPLTITNEGHVIGHVAAWGTPLTHDPTITPPRGCNYERFLAGYVIADDGQQFRTGALTWGIPHADLARSDVEALNHYADSRFGWADVRVGEDAHGPWVTGALRPGLTEDDLRVLRSLSLSGDWRWNSGRYDFIAALAVNYPAFPIPRAVAAAASRTTPTGHPAMRVHGERPLAIVAASMVAPYRDGDDPRLARLEAAMTELRGALAEPHRARLRQIRREVAAARLRG